ncbi:MAG TPA: GntR family transcriptional regulator [Gaiellaceae bacterium]|nr:GntR family transcriptional regulator [Gaiellaceae bacterium]
MTPASSVRNRERPVVVRLDLNDQVYDAIKERLLTREFGGGAKISLQTIADELGVSRSPVHHALTRLTTEGLVVSEPRGYVVRPLTVELMDELHEARLALELHAASLTIGTLDEERLARFRGLMDETIKPVRDRKFVDARAYLLANAAFHEYQVDLAGNATISEMYRRLCVFPLQERALLGLGESAAGDSDAEHRAIVDAFERADEPAAREALRANVETGRRISRAVIERAGGVL